MFTIIAILSLYGCLNEEERSIQKRKAKSDSLKYFKAGFESNKYLWASDDKVFALIDKDEHIIMTVAKDSVKEMPLMLNDQVAKIVYHEVTVLRHINGREIIRDSGSICSYIDLNKRSSYFIYVVGMEKMGLINNNGQRILEGIYDDIYQLDSTDVFWVQYNGNWFLTSNSRKISDNYFFGRTTSCGRVWATKDGVNWGFIDKSGSEIGEFNYSSLNYSNHFSDGMAPVVDRYGKLGFINLKGELVISHKYLPDEHGFSEIGGVKNRFVEGRCKVKKVSGEEVYIDKEGNEYSY